MAKKPIGTTKLRDLKVGHFANVNGNIVYRYMTEPVEAQMYWFPAGIFLIEKHNHLPMLDAFRGYGYNRSEGIEDRGYFCDEIEVPNRFHVDQAINLLKKEVREKNLNGLVYLENYTTLKSYIEADEHETDNLLLNMMSGLEPKDLTERDKMLLKRRYGKDWLFKLGYQTNLEYLEEKERAAALLLRTRHKQ